MALALLAVVVAAAAAYAGAWLGRRHHRRDVEEFDKLRALTLGRTCLCGKTMRLASRGMKASGPQLIESELYRCAANSCGKERVEILSVKDWP